MEVETEEFTPRAYQIDLYEKAVDENTIIYLPTGAGKTFIAVMLIKKLSADLQKPYTEGGKHTVFIVNTVPLVLQQSKYIERLTGLSCGAYSGDMNVDYWKQTDWTNELEKHQLLVMTAQIFLDVLCHGYMLLNKVNLIIFDECHRGVNDHPMRLIMQQFQTCPKDQQPRVLAMTATLLNSNVNINKVETTIQMLELTYHARIATVKRIANIKGYYPTPVETIVEYSPYKNNELLQQIQKIVDEVNKNLELIVLKDSTYQNESSKEFKPRSKTKKLSLTLLDIVEQFVSTGIYGATKSLLLHLVQFESIKKFTDNAADTVCVLEYLMTEVTKLRILLESEMKDSTEMERIHKYSSNQIQKLFAVLKNFNTNKTNEQKFCCIIFVKRRFTAKVLYHILKNLHTHDEEYKFLVPDYVVGFSNNPYKNAREVLCISKWNKEVLHRFKSGHTNCIIATDVVDEGIDIPMCTLVVRYDVPMDIRSYIQSKGRARHASSQYTFLLSKEDTTYINRYHNYKKIEAQLQKTLIGHSEFRAHPSASKINRELYQNNIPPYTVIQKDGTRSVLLEHSAISLVNMYSAMLLKSKFVSLSPIWTLHEVLEDINKDKQFKVALQLPMISPLKKVISGDVMDSIDLAKRSVAMKTCIELHKIGELNDQLIPIPLSCAVDDADYLFPYWIDEEGEDAHLCGTYKKKRQYKLEFPEKLHGAYPVEEEMLVLHILHAKPTYSVPHDNRHLVFYNLLNNDSGFGILSTKKMPEIPSFPIYMNVGELNVDIKVNHAVMRLTGKEIEHLKVFHTMMFSQIVQLIKEFMVFDIANLDNSFLVVPVTCDWEINWDIIKKYECIEKIEPAVPFQFKREDYDLALVIPSYRASPSVYVVTQVCNDLTPGSSFPTDEFYSYCHYYKERHNLIIQDWEQPMLEAKPISKNINCIKPRNMKPGLSKRKRADMLEDFEEHLVPELCYRINFPSLYWLKTTMLPSILHRISQLLIANDLRCIIALETNLGKLSFDSNEKWPPLILSEEEIQESSEPFLQTTDDEIVESSQIKVNSSGPEVDVLNTDGNLYPWSKEQEPTDIFRNVDDIQIIDIQYYCQFMSATCQTNSTCTQPVVNLKKPIPKFVKAPPLKICSTEDTSGPSPVEIMYALTTKLGNDAFNLERLETLGDSFLKFSVSLFLYHCFPNYSEGRLTTLKAKLIGNRNLCYCGRNKSIPGRMKVDHFVPQSNFITPAYTTHRQLQKVLLDAEVSPNVLYELSIPLEERFSGLISENTKDEMEQKVLNWNEAESQTGIEHYLGVQTVSDKTVADCVEALIGVYLKSMGIIAATVLLQWFKILPENLDIQQLICGSPINPFITEGNPNDHMPWASTIEASINYKFKNRAFLLQACTHASYTANRITECYQRLEFLGDAILDFLITCYIYENCGNLSPGELTDLRSALVNNITFACLSVKYGLHTGLLAYTPNLNNVIHRFVKFQQERDHIVNDEVLLILLDEDECNLAEYVDVPKVLGDLFESVIGAVYLDCNKDLSKVWEVIYGLMHDEIENFSKNVPKQPLRVLYETKGACPEFSKATPVENADTVMVTLKVTVAGKLKTYFGFGINKKQAKCAAAKHALKSLLHKA